MVLSILVAAVGAGSRWQLGKDTYKRTYKGTHKGPTLAPAISHFGQTAACVGVGVWEGGGGL